MPVTRQLSAILFADIIGYTALMQENELNAIRIREKFHATLVDACAAHNGRVAQKLGDGAFCIFNSSIEAVRAAIDVQLAMTREPLVPLRIGIHSGDVLVEDENIYGNGVNIASRIESLATSGSILISGIVRDEILNQRDIAAIPLGRFSLKNVNEPFEIYAISNPGIVVPSGSAMEGKGIRFVGKRQRAYFLPVMVALLTVGLVFILFRKNIFNQDIAHAKTAKVIAVIPFTNLGTSQEDTYFVDGICDEVLAHLSKISGLNVLSRTTMVPYRNSNKPLKQIGKEVGADVLLEGSIQKNQDKVKIIVQLIDAHDDNHLWAETYTREIRDVFEIQTTIAKEIAAALNTTLTKKDERALNATPTDNLEAYDFYLKGSKYAETFWDLSEMQETAQAIRMYEEAIRLDPHFTAAYHALIELYADIFWKKTMMNSEPYRAKAGQWMERLEAQHIDDIYTLSANAVYKYKCQRDYTGALSELNKIDKMAGNSKTTHAIRAGVLLRMGEIDESLASMLKLSELFPNTPRLWVEIAEIYKLKRDFTSARRCIDKAIAIAPDIAGFYMNKAMYYAELKGDLDSAYLILRNASNLVDTNAFTLTFTYFEILRGNYQRAIELTQMSSDSLGVLWQYKFVPNSLSLALMYLAQGDSNQSQQHFQRAFALISHLTIEYPDDFRIHAALGIALAGLGKKEEALKEGNRAVELMPVSKDAILGVSSLESLALVHTLLGEEEAAIEMLEDMLNMPFAWTMSNSKALYKMHYYWKPLHGNAKFEGLVD